MLVAACVSFIVLSYDNHASRVSTRVMSNVTQLTLTKKEEWLFSSRWFLALYVSSKQRQSLLIPSHYHGTTLLVILKIIHRLKFFPLSFYSPVIIVFPRKPTKPIHSQPSKSCSIHLTPPYTLHLYLVGVTVVRALVAELHELFLREVLVLGLDEASLAPLVLAPEPEPEEGVDADGHADHAERHGVATHIPWAFRGEAMGKKSWLAEEKREQENRQTVSLMSHARRIGK